MTTVSDDFIAYLKTVDLSTRVLPEASISPILSPDTLLKLLHAETTHCRLPFEPTRGRRLACEFKNCVWTRDRSWNDVLYPQRVCIEVEAHVKYHLKKLDDNKLARARLWHEVPLMQRNSEGLDVLPCFTRCWSLETVPKGAKLAEHLMQKHYDGYAMYSCPLCNMDFALDAEEGVPQHIRKDLTLLSTIPLPRNPHPATQDLETARDAIARHDATAGHNDATFSQPQATHDLLQDMSAIKAQILLLNHYELGCPAIMPILAPRWEEFPDDVREHLERQLRLLAPNALGQLETVAPDAEVHKERQDATDSQPGSDAWADLFALCAASCNYSQ
ncbi:uncharacterized protein SCHCODRAFT_02591464 [Schizophyllum commune H4-8]|uniref:Uncharacterized protein n=1 Tax=Schizophyllum commune (strain H4-8 / FGSC 9210) TaxID=578458 RepID=D8QJF9_SCHCM|nr:uncharacterized protein SCHCODRAFT_02591464 [Schizophyllum commune H4-8]KAI5886347.1 hypothetical protein SCHCODRAFT_02591464 [Schizophyllum commune H4-8]